MNSEKQEILVVDDDQFIRVMLTDYLSTYHYLVTGAASAAEAQNLLESRSYDLILLDFGLPDGDGEELARYWATRSPVPIICITGRDGEVDQALGLELGADDYIIKPFSLRIILARIRAVLRRAARTEQSSTMRSQRPSSFRFANWVLNLNTRRLVSPEEEIVSLTNSEFNLLVALLDSPGCVVSREKLLERIRAFDDIYDRSIDVQIFRLRRKIETTPKRPVLLRTERSGGYFIDAKVEKIWL